MARKLYVIANWKMYKTAREATDYIEALASKVEPCKAHVFLSVPFTSIAPASQYAKSTNITVGAQNMNDAREGAFTGEIAGLMLKEAGAAFVILGHSERRHVFGETNEFIQRKVKRAFQDDLQPILCVGETKKEREAGKTEEVLREQIFIALEGIPKEDIGNLVLAYEPVWAIGTGVTATPKMAQAAHAFCRECLKELFGAKVAGAISIVYGGSVKPENVSSLLAEQDIDGVLVGGASLDPDAFAQIALGCQKKSVRKAAKEPAEKPAKKTVKKTAKKTVKKSKKEKEE